MFMTRTYQTNRSATIPLSTHHRIALTTHYASGSHSCVDGRNALEGFEGLGKAGKQSPSHLNKLTFAGFFFGPNYWLKCGWHYVLVF
jgi:hypothetical protein